MKFTKRASLFVVFTLIALLAALTALLLPSEPQAPAPQLRFTLLDGRALTLDALRERPVLVAFWATTCAPCVEETPDLIKLYQDLNPRGLELIAVAMPYDPPLNVQIFARDRQVPYPIALDIDGAVAREFGGVRSIPAAFLIDPQGRIIYRQSGKLDIERVRALSLPFLADAPKAGARQRAI